MEQEQIMLQKVGETKMTVLYSGFDHSGTEVQYVITKSVFNGHIPREITNSMEDEFYARDEG